MDDLKISDIFGGSTEKARKTAVKEAEKAISLTGQIAQKCLANADFKMYRASYERTERSTVDALIIYTKNFVESPEGDITKYALTTMRLLTKLQDLRYLLNTVSADAKRKEQGPEKDLKFAKEEDEQVKA